MITLEFNVTNQFINRIDTEHPVENSQEYLYAQFNFLTDDWENKTVTAIFTKGNAAYYQLLDENMQCVVPNEVNKSGNFYVSVFAENLITTNSSRVYVQKSNYTEDGENTEPPTPNIYNQILAQFTALRQFVAESLENVDGGLFTDWQDEEE